MWSKPEGSRGTKTIHRAPGQFRGGRLGTVGTGHGLLLSVASTTQRYQRKIRVAIDLRGKTWTAADDEGGMPYSTANGSQPFRRGGIPWGRGCVSAARLSSG